ncbi:MAG: translesion error-prone DNA polymerase V autoproteolytic subunit [Tenuifilum sp.]|uniref:LexA family protein n=1 Tax=Tenuifilum TaxID=2760873 RepID=UPI001B655511|nr:translesion error-prone DNA polymerase V autoproteolytic subunit [Bacteroidales bacterium]HOK61942.1 translesion error-prone DNA polymerase V autoproteolytic subunit [Tenuifilum sp.]MBP9029857.1 translesion error-prone DNA polymerase V autoproteolytic subunit [Bacteroidales bacterium]HOK86739.1 translesion error-prone DNA polymerase V autoproteolytic subunit [Tenuifilum sp.]HON69915.1 translesion error-prone DNA polymerase V autoproteolytic subunit [Tenuifilum sp.]
MRLIKATPKIDFFTADTTSDLSLPLAEGIKAGFPSPAQDYIDLAFDLNKELVKNPSSTFYGRVRGDSMVDEGINDGDILVIDKSLPPTDGRKAVCYIDGEFTLKTIRIKKDGIYLMPANPAYKPIKVTEENDFVVWGIVTYVIHKF